MLSNPAFHADGVCVGNGAANCTVFLFPGVGEQYIGMADALYRREPVFREFLSACAHLLKERCGFDLIAQLYPAGLDVRNEDPGAAVPTLNMPSLLRNSRSLTSYEQAAARTAIAHPILFCVEYALARLLMSWGIVPRAMIGHSLGEYVAACIAGVMSVADAVSVVYERARLIETMHAGAMLGAAATPLELEGLLPHDVGIAAINARALCVISGPQESIDSLRLTLAERGIAHQPVNASHAFHSRMMDPIRDELKRVLRGVALSAPSIPYISNVTGDWIRPEQAADPEYWLEHTCRPVLFGAGIRALYAKGARVFVEAGPGRVLGSFVMQELAGESSAGVTVIPTLPGPNETISSDFVAARAQATLWCVGALPRWRELPLPRHDVPIAYSEGDASPPLMGAYFDEPVRNTQEPEGEIEPILASIWERLLGGGRPDRNDNFFRRGATSLTALRAATHIRERLDLEVPLRVFFERPTLRSLAAWIEHALLSEILESTGREPASAIPEDGANGGGPFSMRLPNGQHVLQYNRAETDHFYHDIFETRVYARNGIVLEGEPVVFDIGANIGLFSLFVRQHTKAARIFAFEPAPPTFDLLRQNLKAAGGENYVFNVGLADRPGRMSLTFYPLSTGMSSFHADEAEERQVLKSIVRNQFASDQTGMCEVMESVDEILDLRMKSVKFECQIRTVSEIIRENGVDRIDLMKIDVQKCERAVLEGIDQEHWPRIRQIVVEVHDKDGRVDDISRLLQRHGFVVIVEQDKLYQGSNIHNLYGMRSVEREACLRAPEAERVHL
jgi:FkbM family methyltransferase